MVNANTYHLAKLVRDSSVVNMEDEGTEVVHRRLNDDEFRRALLDKLAEEVSEAAVAETDEALLQELADIREIIDAILATTEFSNDDLLVLIKRKKEKRGGFADRIYVEKVHCPEGSYWDVYFGKDPATYGLEGYNT